MGYSRGPWVMFWVPFGLEVLKYSFFVISNPNIFIVANNIHSEIDFNKILAG